MKRRGLRIGDPARMFLTLFDPAIALAWVVYRPILGVSLLAVAVAIAITVGMKLGKAKAKRKMQKAIA